MGLPEDDAMNVFLGASKGLLFLVCNLGVNEFLCLGEKTINIARFLCLLE